MRSGCEAIVHFYRSIGEPWWQHRSYENRRQARAFRRDGQEQKKVSASHSTYKTYMLIRQQRALIRARNGRESQQMRPKAMNFLIGENDN